MCTCDQENRPTKSLSSAIPHRKRVNKVFGKRSTRLIDHLLKFIITYLFVGHAPTIVACNAPSSKLSGVFSNLESLKKRNHLTFISL
jgi:hypothetical protein